MVQEAIFTTRTGSIVHAVGRPGRFRVQDGSGAVVTDSPVDLATAFRVLNSLLHAGANRPHLPAVATNPPPPDLIPGASCT